MNNQPNSSLGVFGAYALVCLFGTIGTVITALIGYSNLSRFTVISDQAFVSATVMAALPAGMACMIAFFIHRTYLARRKNPPMTDNGTLPVEST
jgi:hypothetical protein